MNIKTQGEATTDDNLTVYEVSYLLLPSLSQEQVKQSMALGNVFTGILTSMGGTIISGEEPILIDLAYPMTKVVGTTRHKANTGYFGWVKFEIGKEGILAVKKALDANDEVLRYLLIKTVKENTLLNGKMMLRKDTKPQDGGAPEEVVVDPGEVEGEATAAVPADRAMAPVIMAADAVMPGLILSS